MKRLFFAALTITLFFSCSDGKTTVNDGDMNMEADIDTVLDPDSSHFDDDILYLDVDHISDADTSSSDDDEGTQPDEDISTGETHWIAVGADGVIVTSSNGDNWSASNIGEGEQINEIECNASGECLLCGSDGGIYRSPNGLMWAKEPFVASKTLYALFFDGEEWFTGGRRETLYTETEDSWKQLYLSVADDGVAISTVWQLFTCNSTTFLRGNSALYHSDNMQQWTAWSVVDPEHTTPQGNVLCLENGSLIAGFDLYSADGKEWHKRPDDELPSWNIRFEHSGIAQGKDGRIVITGFRFQDDGALGDMYIVYSDDNGVSWQQSDIDDSFVALHHIIGPLATDGAGRWTAITQGGEILLSTDNALSWKMVKDEDDWKMFNIIFRP